MSEYKHYVNPKTPGQLCFVTTRCLDWAHLFMREEMRTRMCLSLLRDCQKERAKLHAYVIMSNHIHAVIRPHDLMTISTLMGKVKVNSETRMRKYLLPSERDQFNQQAGLNSREFWQVSFRANPLYTREVADQKVHYVHQNPVRANLVEAGGDYIWSSLPMLERGLFQDDLSLDLVAIRDIYRSLLEE